MYCFADYHTHTSHSHGKGSVADNVAAAAARGLEIVAVSDHGPRHCFGLGIADLGVLRVIRGELEEACARFPQVQGLVGIEANIISLEGDLDFPPEQAHLADIVLANIHSLVRPKTLKDGLAIWGCHYGAKLWPPLGRRSLLKNTEATLKALYRRKIHILTHPGLRFALDYKAVAQACAQRGTAFEINSSRDYLTPEVIELVAGMGAKFVISSDAHSPRRVGDFAAGLSLAGQAGLTPREILNARAK